MLSSLYTLLFILLASPLSGAVGCMSKSKGITQLDNYAFVQCSCPCGSSSRYQILADRGLCRECRHYRDVKPIQLIKGIPPKHKAIVSNNIIARYFQQKGSLFF